MRVAYLSSVVKRRKLETMESRHQSHLRTSPDFTSFAASPEANPGASERNQGGTCEMAEHHESGKKKKKKKQTKLMKNMPWECSHTATTRHEPRKLGAFG